MKHYFILLAVAIGFVACSNEDNEPNFDFANEVVNSYSNEQIEALIACFDPKTIDYGKLKSDLINGSIYNTNMLMSEDGEVWSKFPMYDGVDPSFWTSANWIFEDDGACKRFLGTQNCGEPVKNELYEWRWSLDRKQQMVVIPAPFDPENKPEYHFRLKIVYYNSPLLIFHQTAHRTVDGDFVWFISRHCVNLRALSHDEVEAIFEECMQ